MMTAVVTQVQYEQVDQLIGRMEKEAEELRALFASLRASVDTLCDGDWQGLGAKSFESEMELRLLPACNRTSEAWITAARALHTIAQIYHLAEDDASGLFRKDGDQALSTGGIQKLPPEWQKLLLAFDGPRTYDIAAALLDLIQFGVKNRGDTVEFFKQTGRLLNELLGERGWVGKMDDLYRTIFVEGLPHRGMINRMLNSNWFGGSLAVVDGFYGFFDDANKGTYGDDGLKNGIVNGSSALVQFLVTKHPIGAAVSLANAANQIVGAVETAGLRMFSDLLVQDPQARAAIQQSIGMMDTAREQVDLNNVVKQIVGGWYDNVGSAFHGVSEMSQANIDGIFRILRDPSMETLSQVGRDVMQVNLEHGYDVYGLQMKNSQTVVNAAANFLDGRIDGIFASATAYTQLAGYSVAQILPLTPSMQEAMTRTLTEQTGRLQMVVDFADFSN
jgi:WXG100 family type VII secretion target